MIFLNLSKDNAKEIADFFKENFSDGWNEQMLISAFSTDRFNCESAVIDNDTVGIISYSFSGDTADIEDIVVKKEFRRNNVGANLLKHALENIKNKGINSVLLEVRESNLPAIKLYEKFGFKKISIRKRYYNDGENAIVMLREL